MGPMGPNEQAQGAKPNAPSPDPRGSDGPGPKWAQWDGARMNVPNGPGPKQAQWTWGPHEWAQWARMNYPGARMDGPGAKYIFRVSEKNSPERSLN